MAACIEKRHPYHPHQHGPGCGHTAIRHDGHIDYLHDGHLHHVHEDHVDEHVIAVDPTNSMHCSRKYAARTRMELPADMRRYRMATTSITS
jgi:hypothetical protein